mmetsp:Transcript_11761/g.31654  ORF Transcript_11761/g.31654 Transcript_11761/m.31654 type:complete len:193 (-) Transcript_11761:304-882(-)
MVYGNAAFGRFLKDHNVVLYSTALSDECVLLPPFRSNGESPLLIAKALVSEVKASETCEERTPGATEGRNAVSGTAGSAGLAAGSGEENTEEYVKLPCEAVRLIEQQLGSLTCKTCGNHFKRRSNLNKHIRHVHACERLYVCKRCGKRFGQKSSVDKHLRVIHSVHVRPAISKESAGLNVSRCSIRANALMA